MTNKLTPHFALDEFLRSEKAAEIGDANRPTALHMERIAMLARTMEQVRMIVGRPIEITSGYRNARVNAAVGGVPTSAHAEGWACDFRVEGMRCYDAGLLIARSPQVQFDQLIHEVSRHVLHLSIDPSRLRRMLLTQRLGAGTRFEQGLHP